MQYSRGDTVPANLERWTTDPLAVPTTSWLASFGNIARHVEIGPASRKVPGNTERESAKCSLSFPVADMPGSAAREAASPLSPWFWAAAALSKSVQTRTPPWESREANWKLMLCASAAPRTPVRAADFKCVRQQTSLMWSSLSRSVRGAAVLNTGASGSVTLAASRRSHTNSEPSSHPATQALPPHGLRRIFEIRLSDVRRRSSRGWLSVKSQMHTIELHARRHPGSVRTSSAASWRGLWAVARMCATLPE
mmetsp:Transcript_11369/g.36356  ORF Transcript_11369/g.36356 Transcript_11369/m.36356 type:complete len:251 (+) Transcript_11369:816-1568(+)